MSNSSLDDDPPSINLGQARMRELRESGLSVIDAMRILQSEIVVVHQGLKPQNYYPALNFCGDSCRDLIESVFEFRKIIANANADDDLNILRLNMLEKISNGLDSLTNGPVKTQCKCSELKFDIFRLNDGNVPGIIKISRIWSTIKGYSLREIKGCKNEIIGKGYFNSLREFNKTLGIICTSFGSSNNEISVFLREQILMIPCVVTLEKKHTITDVSTGVSPWVKWTKPISIERRAIRPTKNPCLGKPDMDGIVDTRPYVYNPIVLKCKDSKNRCVLLSFDNMEEVLSCLFAAIDNIKSSDIEFDNSRVSRFACNPLGYMEIYMEHSIVPMLHIPYMDDIVTISAFDSRVIAVLVTSPPKMSILCIKFDALMKTQTPNLYSYQMYRHFIGYVLKVRQAIYRASEGHSILKCIQCTKPNCGTMMYCDKTSDVAQIAGVAIFCTSCNSTSSKHSMCFSCNKTAHPNFPCNNDIDPESFEFINKMNIKPCPVCKTIIEFTDGCRHMQCRCGTHFCWDCYIVLEDGNVAVNTHMHDVHGGDYGIIRS